MKNNVGSTGSDHDFFEIVLFRNLFGGLGRLGLRCLTSTPRQIEVIFLKLS